MLKGQKMSKMALVESVSGQGERNQAELDELYVKTAQMKINHLLEVIERLQDTFSGLGGRSEQLEESVEGKEEELNKKVAFAKRVLFRAIQHENKGRPCRDRSVGRTNTATTTSEWDKNEGRR